MSFNETIQSKEELRAMIGEPSELVNKKVNSYLDKHCETFISKSPFLTIATADASGNCDVSPRGDEAGFVYILNERQLLIPERPGNKRMDSFTNILENRNIGILFMIPGLGETLRVNGRASIVKDLTLLEKMKARGKTPHLAIGVDVEECFIHCAKAFKRSGLWDPITWLGKNEQPEPAQILLAHSKLKDMSLEEMKERLEESYAKRLY